LAPLPTSEPASIEAAVRQRYSEAAQAREAELCCPVSYDPQYLRVIPQEVLDRDYGCGDPSRHLRPGETVLDLGSGGGKICFIASQAVGPTGRVIGGDMNTDMLALARKSAPVVSAAIGYDNVAFRRGRIQDLALDVDALDALIAETPVRSADDLALLNEKIENLRRIKPLVADQSVDVVVSNCVLNLVSPQDKRKLFTEIHRVLRRGGRAVISDIVCDEPVPSHMREDPELWSGCISGAFLEEGFLEAFEEAGFYGISVLERQETPWRTVQGIEFRSLTVEAFKGKEGPCWEQHHAVIYRGPFREVVDDDGHRLRRGARVAVCEKTFNIYAQAPYRAHFDLVVPHVLPPLPSAQPFTCEPDMKRRSPRETKGAQYDATTEAAACNISGACC